MKIGEKLEESSMAGKGGIEVGGGCELVDFVFSLFIGKVWPIGSGQLELR